MAAKRKRKAKPKAKRGPGQPTKYRPRFCQRVIELAREGYSVAELAADLDVSIQSLYEWKEPHPAFSEAMTRAGQLSLAWWEKQARENLVSEQGRALNATLWSKYLAANHPDPYRETKAIQLTGKDGGPIETLQHLVESVEDEDE